MKLNLTKSDVFDVMAALKDKRIRHTKLAQMAADRLKSNNYTENTDGLRIKHTNKAEAAQNLLNKIVEQL